MTGPRNPLSKPTKERTSLEEGLDRSRKHKLWLNLNSIASLAIVAFLALSFSHLWNDVRGDYTAKTDRLSVIRLSVDHHDGKIFADLFITRAHPMHCVVPEKDIGENVDWGFIDAYKPKDPPVVHFVGKAEPDALTGVLQDNIHVFPVKLERDWLASMYRQVHLAIPGAN